MYFEVAGITVEPWLPPLVAFAVSFFTSMVGISGAFLLLPFQVSFLGYAAPSVSATNLVFNLIAIPSGVWRYAREGRMDWRLAGVISAGTLPGLVLGWWLRVHWLADAATFKLFAALVLAALAVRLFADLSRREARHQQAISLEVHTSLPVRQVFALALVVGVIGGAYGVGGGAFMAPFLVASFGMSLRRTAGATLFATLLTSIAGVLLYQFLPGPSGVATQPDWALGILFGAGGAAGMYAGARMQRHVPQLALKSGLAILLIILAASYVVQYFR
jgi:hypothetical protein